jgi:hypothetical protein
MKKRVISILLVFVIGIFMISLVSAIWPFDSGITGKAIDTYSSSETRNGKFVCSDTDGDLSFESSLNGKGAVIKKNLAKGREVVKEDKCIGKKSDRVKEYYCSKFGSIRSRTSVCENGCGDGACLKDTPGSGDGLICTDSDGPKNFYQKGVAYGEHQRGQGPEIREWEDYCVGRNSVYDFTCRTNIDPNSDKLEVWSDSFNCPNGCEDGACIGDPKVLDSVVIDKEYMKITISDLKKCEPFIYTSDDEGKVVSLNDFVESIGCQNKEEIIKLSDLKKEVRTGGNVVLCDGNDVRRCTNPVKVERGNNGVGKGTSNIRVKNGQWVHHEHASFMLESATKSLGDFKGHEVSIVMNGRRIELSNENPTYRSQILGRSGDLAFRTIELVNVGASGGVATFKIEREEDSTVSGCIDNDGGINVYDASSAQVADGGFVDGCDFLDDPKGVLKEAICDGNKATQVEVDCPDEAPYCNRGVCSNEKPVCTDTDGGRDPNTRGTITEPRLKDGPSHTDYCQNVNTKQPWYNYDCEGDDCPPCEGELCGIREYYCNDPYKTTGFEDVECPNGCKDGACVGDDIGPTQDKYTITRDFGTIVFGDQQDVSDFSNIFGSSIGGSRASYGSGGNDVVVEVFEFDHSISGSEFDRHWRGKIDRGDIDYFKVHEEFGTNTFIGLEGALVLSYDGSDSSGKNLLVSWVSEPVLVVVQVEDQFIIDESSLEELIITYLSRYPSSITSIGDVSGGKSDGLLIERDIGELEFERVRAAKECRILNPQNSDCIRSEAAYGLGDNKEGLDVVEVSAEVNRVQITNNLFISSVESLAKESAWNIERESYSGKHNMFILSDKGDDVILSDKGNDEFDYLLIWYDDNKIISVLIDDWKPRLVDDDVLENLIDVYLDKYPSDLVFGSDDSPDPTSVCRDSDGGKNIFKKGTTIGGGLNDPNPEKFVDFCEDSQTLSEFSCTLDPKSGGQVVRKDRFGPNEGCEKCNNGACVEDNSGSCPQIGLRLDGKYCGFDKNWVGQNEVGSCDNNFECTSNLCIASRCTSLSVWEKFLRFLGVEV